MSMITGLKNLHVAFLDDAQDIASGATTYTDLTAINGVNSIKVDVQSDSATFYGDNGAVETDTTVSQANVSFTVPDISADLLAKMLGLAIDANGGISDVGGSAPYVALGYERTYTNNRKKFVWLYKGKLRFPSEDAKTKTDKVDLQSVTIEGTFIRRRSDSRLNYFADTASKTYKAELGANWFALDTINRTVTP